MAVCGSTPERIKLRTALRRRSWNRRSAGRPARSSADRLVNERLSQEEVEHLKLLTVGHYVVAGLQTLSLLLPIIFLAIGAWVLNSPEAKARPGPANAVFAALFIVLPVVWILTSGTLAACLVIAAKRLAQRRRRTFCLTVAVMTALMAVPFGTVLGIFTIMVLVRPGVRAAFEGANAATALERKGAG